MIIDVWNANGTQMILDERMIGEALVEASALFKGFSRIGVGMTGRWGRF